MQTKRQQQKQETRQALVTASYELYSQYGFSAVRIADIANAANVSHGTVFVHFASQEELLLEVISQYWFKMQARCHELARDCTSLRQMLEAQLQGILEYEGFYTHMVMEQKRLPKAAQSWYAALQSAVSQHFCAAFESDPKCERRALPPLYLLFNTWLGLLHHYLVNRDLFAPNQSVIKKHGKLLIDGFLKLVYD